MCDYVQLYIYADSIDTASTKMIFNQQWEQYEYNNIISCINMSDTDADTEYVKQKACELLYMEQQCNYMHCKNIKM